MLVTSVRKNTQWGEMMSTIKHEPIKHDRLLQVRISKLNNCIQVVGCSASIIILVGLLLRFFLGKEDDDKQDDVGELMKVFERLFVKPKSIGITSIFAVLMVAAQEGLPLIINCSLTYRNKKLQNDHEVIIREPYGCINLGSITTICIEETDHLGLMLKQIEIDKFWVGDQLEAVSSKNVSSILSENIRKAICDGVDAACLGYDSSTGEHIEVDPLLLKVLPWTKENLDIDMVVLKATREVLISSSPDIERSALLIKRNGEGKNKLHLHWRGSPETILTMCSDHYNNDGNTEAMNKEKRAVFQQVVEGMATEGLSSIALAYKLIEDKYDADGHIHKDYYASKLYENGLILLGIVGLKYPSCDLKEKMAVDTFQNAGVNIKLVSSESLSVVRTTAIWCGILRPNQSLDSIVLKGEDFRNFSKEERMKKVDHITVMGSASPSDKLLFVQCLRRKGQVVAFMGAKLSDSPALKEADVGVFMGTENSEMAKESSDIIITKGKLASMVNASLVGRSSYQNCQKFIQFELTIHFSWLLITFLTMAILGQTPISILEFVLVHVMLSTVAALALLTEPAPNKDLWEIPLVNQRGSLITKAMCRNIIIQISYQVGVLLLFQFMGQALFPAGGERTLNKLKEAMIFNCFVLCQVFNQFIAREPENKNVFKGIIGNYLVLVFVGVPIILQVVVMLFATRITDFPRLNWTQWLECALFAVTSCALDCVGKFMTAGFFTNRTSAVRSV